MIYAIQGLKGTPVKIGYTMDETAMQGRIKSIQTGYPYPLRSLVLTEGTKQQEHQLHKLLGDFRLKGEWFEGAKPVMSVVDDLYKHGIDYVLDRLGINWPDDVDEATVAVADSQIPAVFQVPIRLIPDARIAGEAPTYVSVKTTKKNTPEHRYYIVSSLRRWLRERDIKYAINWREGVKSLRQFDDFSDLR